MQREKAFFKKDRGASKIGQLTGVALTENRKETIRVLLHNRDCLRPDKLHNAHLTYRQGGSLSPFQLLIPLGRQALLLEPKSQASCSVTQKPEGQECCTQRAPLKCGCISNRASEEAGRPLETVIPTGNAALLRTTPDAGRLWDFVCTTLALRASIFCQPWLETDLK